MSRFFESKYVFVAVLSLFSFAFTLNMVRGADATGNSHFLLAPNALLPGHFRRPRMVCNGPAFPRPWDGSARARSQRSARSVGWRPHRSRPQRSARSVGWRPHRSRSQHSARSVGWRPHRSRPQRSARSVGWRPHRSRPQRSARSVGWRPHRSRPQRSARSVGRRPHRSRPQRSARSVGWREHHGLNVAQRKFVLRSLEQIASGLRQIGTNTPRIEGG